MNILPSGCPALGRQRAGLLKLGLKLKLCYLFFFVVKIVLLIVYIFYGVSNINALPFVQNESSASSRLQGNSLWNLVAANTTEPESCPDKIARSSSIKNRGSIWRGTPIRATVNSLWGLNILYTMHHVVTCPKHDTANLSKSVTTLFRLCVSRLFISIPSSWIAHIQKDLI